MIINLDKKVVGSNLPELFSLYWDKSFQSKVVTFQFDKLEWISNIAISSVFSWLKHLKTKGFL